MIHMTLKKMIGKNAYTFSFDGQSLFEVVKQSQHLGFSDVFKCGLCESDLLYLTAYTTEKDAYEYVKVKCAKCRASVTFGKTKKDGAFFLRREEGTNKLAWEPAPKSANSGGEE